MLHLCSGTMGLGVFLTFAVMYAFSAPIRIGVLKDYVEQNMPEKCRYSIDLRKGFYYVNVVCPSIGLDYVPVIPDVTATLTMDFNNLPVINYKRLEHANMPTLRELGLSNCHIRSIHPDTFKGTYLCQDLKRIYLANNELESLSDITIAWNNCTGLTIIDARNSTREPPKNEECAEMKDTFPNAIVHCDDTITKIMPTTSRPTLEPSSSTSQTSVPELKTTTKELLTTTQTSVSEIKTTTSPKELLTTTQTSVSEIKTTTSPKELLTTSLVHQKEKDEAEKPNTAMFIGLVVISLLLVIAVAGLIYFYCKNKKISPAHLEVGFERLQGENNMGESSRSLIP